MTDVDAEEVPQDFSEKVQPAEANQHILTNQSVMISDINSEQGEVDLVVSEEVSKVADVSIEPASGVQITSVEPATHEVPLVESSVCESKEAHESIHESMPLTVSDLSTGLTTGVLPTAKDVQSFNAKSTIFSDDHLTITEIHPQFKEENLETPTRPERHAAVQINGLTSVEVEEAVPLSFPGDLKPESFHGRKAHESFTRGNILKVHEVTGYTAETRFESRKRTSHEASVVIDDQEAVVTSDVFTEERPSDFVKEAPSAQTANQQFLPHLALNVSETSPQSKESVLVIAESKSVEAHLSFETVTPVEVREVQPETKEIGFSEKPAFTSRKAEKTFEHHLPLLVSDVSCGDTIVAISEDIKESEAKADVILSQDQSLSVTEVIPGTAAEDLKQSKPNESFANPKISGTIALEVQETVPLSLPRDLDIPREFSAKAQQKVLKQEGIMVSEVTSYAVEEPLDIMKKPKEHGATIMLDDNKALEVTSVISSDAPSDMKFPEATKAQAKTIVLPCKSVNVSSTESEMREADFSPVQDKGKKASITYESKIPLEVLEVLPESKEEHFSEAAKLTARNASKCIDEQTYVEVSDLSSGQTTEDLPVHKLAPQFTADVSITQTESVNVALTESELKENELILDVPTPIHAKSHLTASIPVEIQETTPLNLPADLCPSHKVSAHAKPGFEKHESLLVSEVTDYSDETPLIITKSPKEHTASQIVDDKIAVEVIDVQTEESHQRLEPTKLHESAAKGSFVPLHAVTVSDVETEVKESDLTLDRETDNHAKELFEPQIHVQVTEIQAESPEESFVEKPKFTSMTARKQLPEHNSVIVSDLSSALTVNILPESKEPRKFSADVSFPVNQSVNVSTCQPESKEEQLETEKPFEGQARPVITGSVAMEVEETMSYNLPSNLEPSRDISILAKESVDKHESVIVSEVTQFTTESPLSIQDKPKEHFAATTVDGCQAISVTNVLTSESSSDMKVDEANTLSAKDVYVPHEAISVGTNETVEKETDLTILETEKRIADITFDTVDSVEITEAHPDVKETYFTGTRVQPSKKATETISVESPLVVSEICCDSAVEKIPDAVLLKNVEANVSVEETGHITVTEVEANIKEQILATDERTPVTATPIIGEKLAASVEEITTDDMPEDLKELPKITKTAKINYLPHESVIIEETSQYEEEKDFLKPVMPKHQTPKPLISKVDALQVSEVSTLEMPDNIPLDENYPRKANQDLFTYTALSVCSPETTESEEPLAETTANRWQAEPLIEPENELLVSEVMTQDDEVPFEEKPKFQASTAKCEVNVDTHVSVFDVIISEQTEDITSEEKPKNQAEQSFDVGDAIIVSEIELVDKENILADQVTPKPKAATETVLPEHAVEVIEVLKADKEKEFKPKKPVSARARKSVPIAEAALVNDVEAITQEQEFVMPVKPEQHALKPVLPTEKSLIIEETFVGGTEGELIIKENPEQHVANVCVVSTDAFSVTETTVSDKETALLPDIREERAAQSELLPAESLSVQETFAMCGDSPFVPDEIPSGQSAKESHITTQVAVAEETQPGQTEGILQLPSKPEEKSLASSFDVSEALISTDTQMLVSESILEAQETPETKKAKPILPVKEALNFYQVNVGTSESTLLMDQKPAAHKANETYVCEQAVEVAEELPADKESVLPSFKQPGSVTVSENLELNKAIEVSQIETGLKETELKPSILSDEQRANLVPVSDEALLISITDVTTTESELPEQVQPETKTAKAILPTEKAIEVTESKAEIRESSFITDEWKEERAETLLPYEDSLVITENETLYRENILVDEAPDLKQADSVLPVTEAVQVSESKTEQTETELKLEDIGMRSIQPTLPISEAVEIEEVNISTSEQSRQPDSVPSVKTADVLLPIQKVVSVSETETAICEESYVPQMSPVQKKAQHSIQPEMALVSCEVVEANTQEETLLVPEIPETKVANAFISPEEAIEVNVVETAGKEEEMPEQTMPNNYLADTKIEPHRAIVVEKQDVNEAGGKLEKSEMPSIKAKEIVLPSEACQVTEVIPIEDEGVIQESVKPKQHKAEKYFTAHEALVVEEFEISSKEETFTPKTNKEHYALPIVDVEQAYSVLEFETGTREDEFQAGVLPFEKKASVRVVPDRKKERYDIQEVASDIAPEVSQKQDVRQQTKEEIETTEEIIVEFEESENLRKKRKKVSDLPVIEEISDDETRYKTDTSFKIQPQPKHTIKIEKGGKILRSIIIQKDEQPLVEETLEQLSSPDGTVDVVSKKIIKVIKNGVTVQEIELKPDENPIIEEIIDEDTEKPVDDLPEVFKDEIVLKPEKKTKAKKSVKKPI
ncbi:Uncharacterised protein at_DN1965, partial [Pycnogonum litorale]